MKKNLYMEKLYISLKLNKLIERKKIKKKELKY